MPYIAYNTVKRAYLGMDASKQWTLTTDITKAHRCDTIVHLTNITKSQPKIIPDAWRLDEIAETVKKQEDKPVTEISTAQKEEMLAMIHDKDHPVCGKWIASEEYKAVLDAIGKLKKYATQDYAASLRERLTELNNEMVDLEHYVELTPLNLPRAYKITCQIKNVMQERRDIQQQIQLINRVHTNRLLTDMLSAEWEEPQDEVEKMYTPRTSYGEKLPWKDQIVR